MAYSLYEYDDYKPAIKERVAHLRAKQPGLTLKSLAARLDLQPTYLSRILNDEDSHLGEDHLFRLGTLLKFLADEVDYLMLLRAYRSTQDPKRRSSLFARLDSIRKSHVGRAQVKDRIDALEDEVGYLFTPLCVVVHAALFLDVYAKDPRRLCPFLGISADRLKELLQVLARSEYIRLSESNPFKIEEVMEKYPHFGREHPLMRAHQAAMKSALQARLQQTPEAEKESLLFTFTTDDTGFAKIRADFKKFIEGVQETTFKSPQKGVYQMNFDLLKYF